MSEYLIKPRCYVDNRFLINLWRIDFSSTLAHLTAQLFHILRHATLTTPHASGVAALYWSYNLSFTNKQVGIMLLKFADDLGTPGWDKYYGYGRVDAYPQDG